MQSPAIYFDNHATTQVDPRVLEAMLPYFGAKYGNPGSAGHVFGREAKQTVDDARQRVAAAIGAQPREIVFTSGATESDNLAIHGVAARHADRDRHIISAATEHPAVLEPLERLRRGGFDVTLLPVIAAPDPRAGCVEPERLAAAIRDDTILVSIMLANNEIGAIAPLAEIGRICRQRGVLLHTDAAQALGSLAIDVERLQVDLLSLSGHKIYGPKGVGALYVRSRSPRVRLDPMVAGGGQEGGLRSGTLNVPGIVGLARAAELCVAGLPDEPERLRRLRDTLYEALCRRVGGVSLNGPALDPPQWRLPGNLNVRLSGIDGDSLLLCLDRVALSAGSACASTDPAPSHVLQAIGLDPESARGSVRFGLGRFNTADQVSRAVALIADAAAKLRAMAGGK